ncbi:MAG: restriction endonuclease subunit S [Methanotrichaceae archaeon]|nr:restriction endonuclease subunit S [Methanotrichaceae archaeon]
MEALIDYRGKTPKKTSFGIPLITAKIVKDGRIETPNEFISFEDYEPWMRRGIPKAGDVVITTEAPLGEVAQLGAGRLALAQRLIALRAKASILDNGFLKYLMQSEDVQDQLRARSSGTTVLGIKQSELRKVLLTLPPLPEQRAIARILGALDDKIEANRRMNETLEAIARAIFKSWFVDFDPVRAKAEGREPAGMDAETAALFPDGFEETEGRVVPRGWGVGTIAEEYDLKMGQSPPGDTYNLVGDGIVFYQGRADFGYRYPSVRMYCTAPTRKANPGDALVSVRAPVGDINMALEKCCIGRGLSAIRHKSGSRSFTFYSMLSLNEIFAQFEAEGTVFGSISKKNFRDIACIIPQPEVVEMYEKIAYPLDQMIENNENESRVLADVRDSLLPKLLCGEAKLKNFTYS